MERKPSVSRRLLALILVLGIAFSLTPRVVRAADGSSSPASTAPLAASIAHAARTIPLATAAPASRAAKDDQEKGGSDLTRSSAFFTQPLGIAILAVIAVGTGYAIYSTSHDRIHSEARQGQ